MRIINFIKNYPATLITIFVIVTGILIICMSPKAYAKVLNEKGLDYDCACMSELCDTYYTPCKDDKCPLKIGSIVAKNCTKHRTDACLPIDDGEEDEDGCCDNGCDCNNMCEEFCGNCEYFSVRGGIQCVNGICSFNSLPYSP